MNDRDRDREDVEERLHQASGGEVESGRRAETAEPAEEPDDLSSSGADTPGVREEDARATTERVERMQREGKGLGGTSTDGRADLPGEEEIEKATRGED